MSSQYLPSLDGSKRQRTDAAPNCTIYIPNPSLIGAQVGHSNSHVAFLSFVPCPCTWVDVLDCHHVVVTLLIADCGV